MTVQSGTVSEAPYSKIALTCSFSQSEITILLVITHIIPLHNSNLEDRLFCKKKVLIDMYYELGFYGSVQTE